MPELAVETEVEDGVEIALGKDCVPVTGAVGVAVGVVGAEYHHSHEYVTCAVGVAVGVVGAVVVVDSEVAAGLACVVAVFVSSA